MKVVREIVEVMSVVELVLGKVLVRVEELVVLGGEG